VDELGSAEPPHLPGPDRARLLDLLAGVDQPEKRPPRAP